MKITTTLAFFAGMALTAPSSAEDMGSVSNAQNPQQEDFKSYVIDALDSHKGQAPKEMQGHHEDIKAYVGSALDGQKLAQQKLKDAKNLKEAVLDLVDLSTMPRNVKSSVPMCIKQEAVDETCLGGIIRWQGGNLWRTLYTQCDGTHLWIHWHGACENKYVKQACEAMARLAHIDRSYVQSCLDTPVTN